eukprot:TRINITY_DN48100_c0_g1_i1.p1 TRINITY_DN48100_c0_g1~~TRINITY_DN48100_c0_g1_i1.p1  ORF type:complete len:410 (+),score=66.75 TRINITY_DN48100_c0_g1_i1:698-1927(+)
MKCNCGDCEYCACTQSGCCNRLDRETSGVMIVAKTAKGFGEMRRQFKSNHSLEQGGSEKYYLALVQGEVKLPSKRIEKTKDWIHEPGQNQQWGSCGRINITMKFDEAHGKSCPWHDGSTPPGQYPKSKDSQQWGKNRSEDSWKSGGESTDDSDEVANGRQGALTLYRPIAWFEGNGATGNHQKYTLVELQIITGRRHQIRFHMAQIGYPLVGDIDYGASYQGRAWAKRVWLHSYRTKFREPFTRSWYVATSPMPEDLGNILHTLELKRQAEGLKEKFRSRGEHEKLSRIFAQYAQKEPLVISHNAPENAVDIQERQELATAKAQMWGKRKVESTDFSSSPQKKRRGWNAWGWSSPQKNQTGWNSHSWDNKGDDRWKCDGYSSDCWKAKGWSSYNGYQVCDDKAWESWKA